MNPTLLRIGFVALVCAVLSSGFANELKAQNYDDYASVTEWERSVNADNLPDWFTTNNDRSAAVLYIDGTRHLLIASAPALSDDVHVRIVNAETGADTPFGLDLNNYPEIGTFQLSDVLVSDDNKIFLTNYGENLWNAFQLVMYADTSDSDPEIVLSDSDTVDDDDWGLARTVSITGNYEDGTATVYAISDNGSNSVARYTQTGPGEHFGNTPEIIELPEPVGTNPTASAFETGSAGFYQTGGGQPVRKYDEDGELLGTIPEEVIGTGTMRAIFINSENGDDYVAVYSFSNSNAKLVKVPGGDFEDAFVIASTQSLGDADNANGTGSVDISMGENGSFDVYVLATNNGIGAYHIAEFEEEPETPLAGDYYIPQGDHGQGFESLGAAFDAFNELGLDGATTFYITDDLDETSNVLKLNRNDNSESASLRIAPAADTSPTITVAANNSADDENENVGLLILNSNWVTIDGCDEVCGENGHLTISSNDGNVGGNGLISVYGSSSNITIKNTNIVYAGDNGDAVGIRARRNNANTAGIVNLLIEGNTIGTEDVPFSDGLRLWGSEENPNNTSAVNNQIYASHRGITTFWNVDNVFDGNKIWLVNPKEDVGFYSGIYLALTSGETIITNNEFKNLAVNRSESASYAGGIVINSILGPHHITNNTFAAAAFENTGAAEGNSVYGIVLNNAAGNSENFIYHNSFRIGLSNESGTHAAFGVEGVDGTTQTWNFVNNLYTIENESDNSFAYSWPFEVEAFHSDYNNFDLSGTAGVATFGEGRFDSLVDWTPENGADENSSEVAVEFVSETDLRLTGSSIGDDNLAGTLLESVATDIDGTERNAFAPYKGAFEGDVALTGDVQIGTFALIAPSDGFELNLQGESDQEIEISWEEPAANESVTYTWHADSVGGDFSDPLLSVPSDGDGSETTLTFTYETIDTILNAQGVEEGETAEFIWTVTAHADDVVRFANEPYELTITRNLSVSREIAETPVEFSLSQNYPNPFNPTSTIEFTLPETADVVLEVYNINGQLVSTLVDSRMNSGQHSVVFDASNLASGVYLYRIRAGNYMETRQMTLIK